ncbi:DUF167 family protein YggU [Motilimonas eburnea]|uniref:DUF167 family protein YggU n=1 Tax=Motilimonas eburnea TaxID=1737488 RepID=UPI001E511CF4|nr:DUF167 family protein YggU [Motilimonas eburnea]MCE2571376.1 DUF167 family protein YggU [Motilimonas eburnea]
MSSQTNVFQGGQACLATLDKNTHAPSSLLLHIYLQPKAAKDAIVGLHDGELKITITAPPVDGQANRHLVKFLSKQCKTAKSQISIEKGELSRHKQVRIDQPKVIPEVILSLMDHN